VEFFVKFVAGLPKLAHTLTQTPRKLGKLLRAEQNKYDYKNQRPLSRPWHHESDRMHIKTLVWDDGWLLAASGFISPRLARHVTHQFSAMEPEF
jgi:hypothetical protein